MDWAIKEVLRKYMHSVYRNIYVLLCDSLHSESHRSHYKLYRASAGAGGGGATQAGGDAAGPVTACFGGQFRFQYDELRFHVFICISCVHLILTNQT